ncbi:soluble quino protein glucose dehydrogenase [Tuber magnatum]|uniref:Soluble quino protein glucose dehydrogenase n=1 Tax=Tuber magnatum TaxID=42249 RepID=A0A317SRC5_9PEZI|nr:soluble quino protein glucose dehydrogenase [Tuber magnatum]
MSNIKFLLWVLMVFNQTFAVSRDSDAPTVCKINQGSLNYPSPSIADGYTYQLLTDQLNRPRNLIFDTDGNLLVSGDPDGIFVLRIREVGHGCVMYDGKTLLEGTSGLNLNHGLALSRDGRTLFASSANIAYSWKYDPTTPSIDNSSRRNVVTGMDSDGHTTRTLLTSKLYSDVLLVSRGSNGNLDMDAKHLPKGKCMIKAFSHSKTEEQDFATQGNLLGWGLRNSVGIGEDSRGGIWAVENSADNLIRERINIHQNNPAEELNFLGPLKETAFREGYVAPNYGYPYCFAAWNPKDITPATYAIGVGDQFALVMNNSFTDSTCRDKFQAPRLSFQAHVAPLDIKFHPQTGHAWISFHGSWNRDAPVGYSLSVVEFQGSEPKAPKNSTNSAMNIMWNGNIAGCPSKCFRPVGIAFDSAGRVWVTSDSTGEIYIITPPQSSLSELPLSNGTRDTNSASNFSRRHSGAAPLIHGGVSLTKIIVGVAVICALLLGGRVPML